MDNSDLVRPEGWQRDSVENYGIPANPAERKQYEREQTQQFQQSMTTAQNNTPQTPQQDLTGKEKVYLVNNKARPIHINVGNEKLIIDGQLAVSAAGPFLTISKEQYDSSYQLQLLEEKPVSTINPALRNVPQIQRVNESQYKQLYREYVTKKAIRDKEFATEKSNVNRHADGTIDEFDRDMEIGKINPKIRRAQG